MPQFDPTSFSTQVFWLAVSFITLLVIMTKVALPKIGEVLDERQRKIDDYLNRAQALNAEADAAMAAYEKAVAESRVQAQAMLKETQERLAKDAEQRSRELGDRLAEQIKAGESRIAEAKAQALAHVRELATDVARAATNRLVGVNPSDAKLTAAVSAAMQEKH